MKITENTTIKDLLPEGYGDLGSIKVDCHIDLGDDRNQGLIKIRVEKEKEKNFDWYIKEYCGLRFLMNVGINYDQRDNAARFFLDKFLTRHYNDIPREIKFGLFSTICYDLGSFMDELHYYFTNKHFSKPVQDICPKDFLESIFE